MEITIPENPNIFDAQYAYKQLLDLKVDTKKLLVENFVIKLNPKQFIFLICITSYEGKNFNLNLKFIKKYISRINIQDKNILLYLEGHLHEFFLKKYETEECYQAFYSFFENLYKKEINIILSKRKPINQHKILFFVHSPVFLAHTNPLFYMLKNRKDLNVKICVASLREDMDFTNALKEIGVNFVLLKGKDLINQLNSLILLSSFYSKVIWQSSPLYLAFLSSRVDNICLWSFKFHPKFDNVKKKLSSMLSYKKNVFFKGSKWINIDVGFNIYNLNTISKKWDERKLKFGAFCREELIDTKEYWVTIKSILENVKDSTFYYCGRKKIHTQWCENLSIPKDNIIFLGWLAEPHIKLKEMAFILDGYKLGHGYIAYEAMAAGVPIMFPYFRKSYGTMEMFTKKLSTHPSYKENLVGYKKYFLSFRNNNEANNIANKLMMEEQFNSYYGKFNKELISIYPKNNFEDFCNIVLN